MAGGIIIGAAGGLGEGLQQLGMAQFKSNLDEEQAARNDARTRSNLQYGADIQQQKAEALEVFKQTLQQAPLKRLGSVAQRMAGEDVPVTAAPVKMLSGADPALTNGGYEGPDSQKPDTGMVGDYEKLKARAAGLPPEDQGPYLAQLARQFGADTQTAQGIVAGAQRKRTPDEALQAAADDAKVNDPVAYAQYQKDIGTPMRAERREDTREQREDTRAKTDEQRAITYDKKTDSQDAYNQRREDRLDEMARLQEQRLTNQGDKAETQSQRLAITNLMTSTEKELERNMALAKDAVDEGQKAMFNNRMSGLTRDLTRYRTALEGVGGVAAASPPPPPRNGWNSDTGEVFKDGSVIGKATSESDARALAAGTTPKPSAAPPPPAASTPVEAVNPPGSEAARVTASREAAQAQQERAVEDQRYAAQSAAVTALSGKDARAAAKAQTLPGFGLLDRDTRARIFQLVNGR